MQSKDPGPVPPLTDIMAMAVWYSAAHFPGLTQFRPSRDSHSTMNGSSCISPHLRHGLSSRILLNASALAPPSQKTQHCHGHDKVQSA